MNLLKIALKNSFILYFENLYIIEYEFFLNNFILIYQEEKKLFK
jgi:hypothetical protein